MNKILLGTICGIIFGVIAVLTMIPLQFEDKRRAMTGAFINRFSIGFVIGASVLPCPRGYKVCCLVSYSAYPMPSLPKPLFRSTI